MDPLSSLDDPVSSLTDPLQRPQIVPGPLSCFKAVAHKYFPFDFYLLKEMYVYVCACPQHMWGSQKRVFKRELFPFMMWA